jgi:hypothetical protein
MIPILLSRKLCIGILGDEVAEYGLLSLEFAGFVVWFDPVGDGASSIL